MQIGVPLTVPVGNHIDRNAVRKDGDVGAVIGVKPAQKNLFRFAAAGMLGNHQAGRQLQHILRGTIGTHLQIKLADPFRRSRRIRTLTFHQNCRQVNRTGLQPKLDGNRLPSRNYNRLLRWFVSQMRSQDAVSSRWNVGNFKTTINGRATPQECPG